MSKNLWIGIAIVVLVLGGWFFMQSQKSSQPASSSTPQVQVETPAASSSATAEVMDKKVVTITSAGFSPKDITVKVGETVVWINQDTNPHTVNSDPHPTHTVYQPINQVGRIQASEEKSFTFDKAGTYKYHDHLNPSLTGIVTVQ